MRKLIKGIIINPKSDYKIDIYVNGSILIDSNGKIENIFEKEINLDEINVNVVYDFANKLIIPGLIDLHSHIPQMQAMGIGQGELLDWLNKYIFPLEAKFSDIKFAEDYTSLFYSKLISKGTTTAVLYSSPQMEACDLAFAIANEYKIRAYIGLPLMDENTPISLLQDTEKVLKDIEILSKKWHKKGKLEFVLTPRFALSCSKKLMTTIGEIAKSDGFFIQTHLAENKTELLEVSKHFSDAKNYTDVYDKFGLLTERTILAHCIYLSNEEIETIAKRNCIIAHCPTSNRFLRSGIMPLDKYIKSGLKVGLGTDVAAGYSLSLLHETMEAIENSKILSTFNKENSKCVDANTAFCLATIKGAEHLRISDKVGNFEVGKQADIAVFDLPDYIKKEDIKVDELLNVLIYNTENRDAYAVFIDGNFIYKQ